jgi:hypothetical protein
MLGQEVRAMRKTTRQELSPEREAQLREALSERFPAGWGKGKTLDEMVAAASRAALEGAARGSSRSARSRS